MKPKDSTELEISVDRKIGDSGRQDYLIKIKRIGTISFK